MLRGDLSTPTDTVYNNTVHSTVGRIGFLRSKYEVFENESSLEVCATIFEPSLANVSSGVDAFIFAKTLEGTAQSVYMG